MYTKPIGEKPLPIERKIIERVTSQIYFLQVDELMTEEVVIVRLADHIAAIETPPYLVSTKDGIGRMIATGFISGEVTREEALMSYHMAMTKPVEAGAEGLTVMLKVLAAEEIQRFVAYQMTTPIDEWSVELHEVI